MPVLPLSNFCSPARIGAKFISHNSRRKLALTVVLCLLAVLAGAPAFAVTPTKVHKTHHSTLSSSLALAL